MAEFRAPNPVGDLERDADVNGDEADAKASKPVRLVPVGEVVEDVEGGEVDAANEDREFDARLPLPLPLALANGDGEGLPPNIDGPLVFEKGEEVEA